MATAAQWVAGARPQTLPASVAPVLVGAATALTGWQYAVWWSVLLAAIVALALQVGVNYANDYSDGIRGTDSDRVGPMRLVGSGAASPQSVRNAAFGAFGVAALAGLTAVAISGMGWLLIIGVVAIPAAWFYTGGKHPYGYAGLGEVFVFVFFGLVATIGTHLLLSGTDVGWDTLIGAVAVGCVACAILVANNLRDIDGDRAVGKRTLATRLGDAATRRLYVGLVAVTLAGVGALGVLLTPWSLLGLLAAVPLARASATVVRGATGRRLIDVLKLTGVGELLLGVGVLVGVLIAGVVS